MPTGKNVLYYGDNLDVLRRYVKDESVDLVYLDPPFKSNQDYNVLFAQKGTRSAAQIKAFEDTWRWDTAAASAFQKTVESGGQVAQAMRAFRTLLGDSDMLAYLSMMAPRLIALHSALKPTGSLYLHCDPAASHYLKLLLDSVFGPTQFRSEIIWKRTSAHSSAKRYGPVHDTLLFYTKGDTYTWNQQYQEYDQYYLDQFYTHVDDDGRRWRRSDLTGAGVRHGETGKTWRGIDVTAKGRHWAYPPSVLQEMDAAGKIHWPKKVGGVPMFKRYADEQPGVPLQDVWTDIGPMHNLSRERLGYPTQKPEALLERILRASSNKGDTVLDPFCGCGTTIAVAQQLERRWIGIDITHLAINLIRHRLITAHGLLATYTVVGEPVALEEAAALAEEDAYQFQWWALGLVGARPVEQKKGADRGIDGRLYFHDTPGGQTRQVIISVKSGNTSAQHVRDLRGVVEREAAELGLLITLKEPSKAMRKEAASGGFWESPGGTQHPRLQILTVGELLKGSTIDYPPARPARARPPVKPERPEQLVLGEERKAAEAVAPKRRPQPVPDLVADLLERAGVTRPPVRLEPILERLNMELSARPGQKEDAQLVAMTDPARGRPTAWMVYYNPDKPEARRRFTLAHEVGHVLLHGDEWLAAAARGGGGGRTKRRERDVERFAAELLMPAAFVRAAIEQYGLSAERLAELFGVSRRAMEIRLSELKIS